MIFANAEPEEAGRVLADLDRDIVALLPIANDAKRLLARADLIGHLKVHLPVGHKKQGGLNAIDQHFDGFSLSGQR
jgi:hypothetical protein